MDLDRREAWVDGDSVHLTPTDWNLLLTFVQDPGKVLAPEQTLDLAWRDPFAIGPDRVEFAVLRLRRRVGWDDVSTSPLESVRSFGYRYRPRR